MRLGLVLRALGFCHGDECLPQGPAARSCLRVVWQPDRIPKDLPLVAPKEGPGDD